jgi:phage terminase large subunit-like protein
MAAKRKKAKPKRAAPRPTYTKSRNDPTTQWALDAVNGKVVVGELVAAACRRHLRDLKEGHKRGLVWNVEAANRAINFFPSVLTVTAGSKAGKPFELLGWMVFCVGSLFGWHKKSGRLRFRHAWFETGKGQAKSPLMAAIGLYMIGFRDVPRAEGYAIAWDKDQANVPFKDAVAMCRAPIPGQDHIDEELRDTLENQGEVRIRGTLDNAWKIEFPHTNSKFQSLANGENISGPRPSYVLADEVHEFKSGEPLELWKRAIAKLPGDALMIMGTNTPATNQITGTTYSEFYQKVAKGTFIDDEAFSFIARVDKKDDPFKDEKCWQKALPALGVTFPIENIRGEVATARNSLSTKLSVQRLYFGMPVGSTGFWISEEAWMAVQGKLDLAALKGCKCWLALDLSQKNDLTALSVVWIDEAGHLWAKTFYWTTEAGLEERALADQAPYPQWVQDGWLEAVPGAVIDKTYVAAKVAELCAEFDVQELAFDAAGMADFEAACGAIGFPVWRYEGKDKNGNEKPVGIGLKLMPHAQGTKVMFEDRQLCMPRSVERLEDRILNKTITVEASPVTYMCAANTQLAVDGLKNRAFDKKRSRGRIDGNVTLAMGVGAATANAAADDGASVYETDDFIL